MGLDITYYKNIRASDCVFDEGGDPIDPITRQYRNNTARLYVNPDFPGREDGIPNAGAVDYDDAEGFRAGSYGGYNHWREQLAKMAGYPQAEYEQWGVKEMRHDAGARVAGSGPFFELIWFSDCEGVIGPKVSAKLAKDFADFQHKADAFDDKTGWFQKQYALWRKAFEVASQNGAVKFH